MWKRVKEEGYPTDSRMVFITDGENVNMAHWFSDTLLPRTKEEQKRDAEHRRGGPVWANQHWRIIGNAYLSIEAVTHWADIHDLPMPRMESGRVKTFKLKDQIVYIPDHAEGHLSHLDVEFGFVTSVKGDVVFCRYWSKHDPRELRTKANSEGTPVANLVRYVSRSQAEVEEAFAEFVDIGAS